MPPLDAKPVEAATVEELPFGPEWQYEPKYGGFRCRAFRQGGEVQLQSKKQKPLQRYFPEEWCCDGRGGGSGFAGRAPGGISRWSGRGREPVPLNQIPVAEVSADHITENHMCHGARLLRFRQDKPREDCRMDQIG